MILFLVVIGLGGYYLYSSNSKVILNNSFKVFERIGSYVENPIKLDKSENQSIMGTFSFNVEESTELEMLNNIEFNYEVANTKDLFKASLGINKNNEYLGAVQLFSNEETGYIFLDKIFDKYIEYSELKGLVTATDPNKEEEYEYLYDFLVKSIIKNAIDNNFSSKCSYINGTNGVLMNVTYTFNEYAKVNYYSVTTAGGVNNTLQRDPVSWRLEGWNVGVDPVVLDEVTDHAWANVKRAQVLRKIDVPNIYKYYKLYLTKKATENSNGVHIGEFQLIGTLESSLLSGTQNPENKSIISVYASEKSIVINNPANQVVSYQIFDITGKKVKSGIAGPSQNQIFMNNGLYIVRTNAGDVSNSSKVLIH